MSRSLIRHPYTASSIWRIDAYDALRSAGMWPEGKALNQAEPEARIDLLRAAVDLIRTRLRRPYAWPDGAAALRALEEIALVNGIVLPPAAGGCWTLPKATATIGDASAMCA